MELFYCFTGKILSLLQDAHAYTLSTFRFISKISFISKVSVKMAFIKVQIFLEGESVDERFQSGFKNYRSTKTAIFKMIFLHNLI